MAIGKPTESEPGREGRQIQLPAVKLLTEEEGTSSGPLKVLPSQRQPEQMFPLQIKTIKFRRKISKGLSRGFPRNKGRTGVEGKA